MPSRSTRLPVRRPLLRVPPPARLARFVAGLAMCALGVWLSVRAQLGLSPWDVLHAGLSSHLGLSFGTVVVLAGLVVMAVSWALGVRPGLGTLVNVVAVGWVLDRLIGSPWLADLHTAPLAVRLLALVAAVLLLGSGAAVYIGAAFGAGPRDSLMVAAHLHHLPLGPSRVVVELAVVLVGWLLGGSVGIGTIVLAVGVGPAVQVSFRLLREEPPAAPEPARGARPDPVPAR